VVNDTLKISNKARALQDTVTLMLKKFDPHISAICDRVTGERKKKGCYQG